MARKNRRYKKQLAVATVQRREVDAKPDILDRTDLFANAIQTVSPMRRNDEAAKQQLCNNKSEPKESFENGADVVSIYEMMDFLFHVGSLQYKSEEEQEAIKQHRTLLFQDHPVQDDCLICFLPLPLTSDQRSYKSCCGKVLCFACSDVLREDSTKGDMCPFCKVVTTGSNIVQLVKKRVKRDDPDALLVLASMHMQGLYGHRANSKRAMVLM